MDSLGLGITFLGPKGFSPSRGYAGAANVAQNWEKAKDQPKPYISFRSKPNPQKYNLCFVIP